MEFIIIAYDGRDSDAPNRRAKVRDAHLRKVAQMKEEGKVLVTGSILDDEGRVIGSIGFLDFPSRLELDAWLNSDPYVTRGVWQKVEVHPFRISYLKKTS
jgi:uncharacterized protein YciI